MFLASWSVLGLSPRCCFCCCYCCCCCCCLSFFFRLFKNFLLLLFFFFFWKIDASAVDPPQQQEVVMIVMVAKAAVVAVSAYLAACCWCCCFTAGCVAKHVRNSAPPRQNHRQREPRPQNKIDSSASTKSPTKRANVDANARKLLTLFIADWLRECQNEGGGLTHTAAVQPKHYQDARGKRLTHPLRLLSNCLTVSMKPVDVLRT